MVPSSVIAPEQSALEQDSRITHSVTGNFLRNSGNEDLLKVNPHFPFSRTLSDSVKEILSPTCPSGHSRIIHLPFTPSVAVSTHRCRVPGSNAFDCHAFYGIVRFIFSSSSLKERALKSAHTPTALDQVKLPRQRQPPLTSLREDTSARKLLPSPSQPPSHPCSALAFRFIDSLSC